MENTSLKRILYVEDEPDIQVVARLALENIGGFTLKVCSSGNEAVSAAADFAPDMIVLDVMMPGLDGPTTLQELRKISSLADTPAVFMTAKVQPQEVAHYKRIGAIDVIVKPFDPITLSSSLAAVWERWHAAQGHTVTAA